MNRFRRYSDVSASIDRAHAVAALALSTLALAAPGCGGSDREPAPTAVAEAERPPEGARERGPERPRLRTARCPAELANCEAVTGSVLYVEAVDPDGDGDAHYVLSGGSVTFPGISVIDVKPSLRPERLPRPGDRVSAAGPVYRGSYGQRQIEAVTVHHER